MISKVVGILRTSAVIIALLWANTAIAQPTVTINETDALSLPTNVDPVSFTVVFSESVTGFTDDSNLTFGGTAQGTLSAVVIETTPGLIYNVLVTGMTTSGTVTASVNAGAAENGAMQPSLASTSTDNEITFGATPSVTINQAGGQTDPTSSLPIEFTILFSEPVSGFLDDTEVTYGGTAPGTPSGTVTPVSATEYTLAVTGLTGAGTITASLNAGAGTATGGTNEPSAASSSSDNQVTLDVSGPTVTIEQDISQNDPTNNPSILYRVEFSEPVNGFTDDTNLTFSGTATGTLSATVMEIAPNNLTTYEISVSGASGSGTVIVSVNAAAATAVGGLMLPSEASTSTDNVVTYDEDDPVIVAPFFAPADDEIDVPVALNELQLFFNEDIQIRDPGTIDSDNDRIRIRTNLSNALVIPKNSPAISITGSIVTIDLSIADPAFSFNSNTNYNVRVGNDVFEDLAANNYSGITSTNTWDFTTIGLGVSGPTESLCIGTNYFDIGDITVSEAADNDFGSGNGQSFILGMPSGFELEPGVGSISTTGTDISNASLAIGLSSIVVFYDIGGSSDNDQFVISGLRARAPSGPGTGQILRTGGTAVQSGNEVVDANAHGDLSSSASTLTFSNDATANTICANESITFTATATGATSYELRINGAIEETNSTGNFIPVSGLSNGDVVSINTTGGACDEYDEVTITVNPLPVADAGAPQTICALEEFMLGGNPTLTGATTGPYTYVWTGPGGFSSADPNPTATAPDPGASDQNYNYSVAITDANTCVSVSDVVVITVRNISENVAIDNPPQFDFTVSDPPVQLEGSPAGGVFSGPGVGLLGNGEYEFDPANAGSTNSPHLITYTTTLANTCTKSIDQLFNVTNANDIIQGLPANQNICTNEDRIAINVDPDIVSLLSLFGLQVLRIDSDEGGVVQDGSNTFFDPKLATPGLNQLYVVYVRIGQTLENTAFFTNIEVNEVPDLFFSNLESGNSNPLSFCRTDSEFIISGNQPSGIWEIGKDGTNFQIATGGGVNGLSSIDGTQAIFNPGNTSSTGNWTIRYSLDPGTFGSTNQACDSVIIENIIVNPLPTLTFEGNSEVTEGEEYCYDSPEERILASPSTNGISRFTGYGILNTVDGEAIFSPRAAIDQIEFDTNLPVTTPQTIDLVYEYRANSTECVNTITRTVTVYPLPPASFTISEASLCSNSPDQLIDFGENSGRFSIEYPDGSVVSNDLTSDFIFTPQAQFDEAVSRGHNELDPASFKIVWSVENIIAGPKSCTNFVDTTLVVTPLQPVAMAGIDFEEYVCNNDENILIEVSPIDTDATLNLDGSPVALTNGNQFIFRPTNFNPDTLNLDYSVTTGNGCRSTITKTIFVIPSPEANFNVGLHCDGDTISFNVTNTANTAQFRWNFGDGIGSSSQADTVYQFNRTGIFSVGLAQRSSPEPNSGLVCISTDTAVVDVGPFPNVDFIFNNICESDFTQFTSTSDISIDEYRWTFGDGMNSIEENPTNDYTSLGNFNVTLIAETVNNCADTVSKKVTIFPNLSPTEAQPYAMTDIGGGRGGWEDANLFGDANTIWEFGQANGTVINSAENAWVTNLDGTYDPNTQAFVNSPCFDLSGFQRPVVSLDIWSDTQRESDGAVFQYSTDGGLTWNTLGSIQNGESTGLNWYNQSGITGSPGGQQLFGWSRQGDTDWSTARHALDEIPLALRNNVRFRVGFGSNGDTEFEGFAFKNVRIEERNKVVLLETFTNTSATNVTGVTNAFNNFGSGSGELIKLQYHTSFPGEDFINSQNLADHNARAAFYGVNALPGTFLDGNISEGNLQSWLDLNFSRRTLTTSPFEVSVSTAVDGNNLVINTEVLAISDLDEGNVVAHIALIEREITDPSVIGSNGITQFNAVLRKFVPSAAGIIMNDGAITRDQVFNLSESVQLDNQLLFDPDQLSIVVFLQNDNTKEVYQTVQVEPAALPPLVTEIEEEALQNGIYLFPNPANQKVTLTFAASINTEVPLAIYDQFGKAVYIKNLPSGLEQVEIDTHDLVPGLYHVQLQLSDGAVIRERLVVMHR